MEINAVLPGLDHRLSITETELLTIGQIPVASLCFFRYNSKF